MPRLRYLKKYQRIEVEYEEGNTGIARGQVPSSNLATNEGLYEAVEDENNSKSWPRSGQSWLSNATIIASMSDAKLKSTLSYYKGMQVLLEAELQVRSFASKAHGFHEVRKAYEQANQTRKRAGGASLHARTKQVSLFRGLKLSKQLKEKLKQCLNDFVFLIGILLGFG